MGRVEDGDNPREPLPLGTDVSRGFVVGVVYDGNWELRSTILNVYRFELRSALLSVQCMVCCSHV